MREHLIPSGDYTGNSTDGYTCSAASDQYWLFRLDGENRGTVQINSTGLNDDGTVTLLKSVDGVNYSSVTGVSETINSSTTFGVIEIIDATPGIYKLNFAHGSITTGTLQAMYDGG